MPFEPLAYVHTMTLAGIPQEWLPLIFAFDPDLPLFPLLYFHVLARDHSRRPRDTERAYGYIRSADVDPESGTLSARLICNKKLSLQQEWDRFGDAVKDAIAGRLGAANPVTLDDVEGVFDEESGFADRIPVLREMWHRTVDHAYGGVLPFGAFWDPVLGMARYYASFYAPGGRKSELIQTHYFASRFGEPIQCASGVPPTDFFLLPTWDELVDEANPLASFSRYKALVDGCRSLCEMKISGHTCFVQVELLKGVHYTGFSMPSLKTGKRKLNTAFIEETISLLGNSEHRSALTECFNALDKGPFRTLIFAMFLNDIRQLNAPSPKPGGGKRIQPNSMSEVEAATLVTDMTGFYQSPKAISIYAQQCHANEHALPLDTWIGSFFAWPLNVAEYRPDTRQLSGTGKNRKVLRDCIAAANRLGKVERLLWVTAQARKVHSSACNDAFWCVKGPRAANPLACNVCLAQVRECCPAFNAIAEKIVTFNKKKPPSAGFSVLTEYGDDTPGQRVVGCIGAGGVADFDTPVDVPDGCALFPAKKHDGREPMSVREFVDRY